LGNHVLTTSLIAWVITQSAKVLVDFFKTHHLHIGLWASPGGMPSSHAAFVSALATAVGLDQGFGSALFAACVVFASVVMYDAAGVRRAASIQARLINQIVDELFQGQPIREERLRELLGHTPIEVVVGALMGVLIAWWLAT